MNQTFLRHLISMILKYTDHQFKDKYLRFSIEAGKILSVQKTGQPNHNSYSPINLSIVGISGLDSMENNQNTLM